MVKFLIQRPIAVLMAFTACFIVGLVTYFTLPVSLLPDIAIPEITVQVTAPNTSARELENTIVRPLRQQLIQVARLKDMDSGTRDGAALIRYTFSKWYFVVPYLVWFFALWFHLTHGVWSMFQTVGWANDTWYPRLKCTANIVATLIFLGFAAVVVVYFLQSLCPCCNGVSC